MFLVDELFNFYVTVCYTVNPFFDLRLNLALRNIWAMFTLILIHTCFCLHFTACFLSSRQFHLFYLLFYLLVFDMLFSCVETNHFSASFDEFNEKLKTAWWNWYSFENHVSVFKGAWSRFSSGCKDPATSLKVVVVRINKFWGM